MPNGHTSGRTTSTRADQFSLAAIAFALVTAKAKLAGLWIERSERKSLGDLNSLSDAELAAIRAGWPAAG